MYILLLSTLIGLAASQEPECTNVGFYRHPADCHRFFRCVDTYGVGILQMYLFDCPAGTVFDENLSVCNWPWASAPCDGAPLPPLPPVEASTPPPPETTTNSVVIVEPQFDFLCTAQGTFEHDSDCARFWLCRQDADTNELEPALFKCPDGYLYHDEVRRCLKEEEVECDKVPDIQRIALEPKPIQLRVSELDSFFARWSGPFFKGRK